MWRHWYKVLPLLTILGLIITSVACSKIVSSDMVLSTSAELTSTTNIEAELPGSFTAENIGQQICVKGEIKFINIDESEGVFAELQAEGSSIGIFAEKQKWDTWSKDVKDLYKMGQWVVAEGILRSLQDKLVIILSSPPRPMDIIAQESESNEETIIELPEAPENYKIDVPILYSGLEDMPALCYLGAFSMVAKHHYPEFEFCDAVAYGGVGVNALYIQPPGSSAFLANGIWDSSIIYLTRNVNASFILGLKEGGFDSDPNNPFILKFKDEASEVVYFGNSNEAVDYLKRAIASDHPVEVHLDLYYVYDDFSVISDYWKTLGKEHASHYMTVIGYDTEYIYLNDPTDPTASAANLSTKIDNFILAWEKTSEFKEAPPVGPFWIVYMSQTGTKKSVNEVISWNAEKGKSAPSEIRKFSANPNSSDSTCFMFIELAKGRLEFANFLEKNNMKQAASLYKESGNLFRTQAIEGNITSEDLNSIADKEEKALELLSE